MKRIMAGFGSLVVILTFAAVCSTQGISQAVSGTRLTDDTGGYSFGAPAGWNNSRGEGGYVLVNPAKTIIIAVKPHNYENFEAAVRDTQLDDDSRVVGEPQDLRNGNTVRVHQRTPKGVLVIDFFVLFSPNGGGAAILAMSNTADADTSFDAGLAVSQSVVFTRSRPSGESASSPWHSMLAGKHLLYMYSGNGYFEERHIYLCSSGEFMQTTGSGGFTPGDSDGGSFAGRGGNRGQWGISGSTLVLRYQDGTVGQYTLSSRQARNEVGMNGKRYFIQSQNVCR